MWECLSATMGCAGRSTMTPGEELWGNFDLVLDDRGRLAVPARFRRLFERGGRLSLGADGQVELWTTEGYTEGSVAYTERPIVTHEGRRLRRQRYGWTWDVDLDKQGRILIPPKLRQKGDLDGAVIVWGRGDCLEIWNPQRWEAEQEQWANEEEGR